MIRYLKQEEISLKQYDTCVKADPRGLIYGCSWYLDTVCEYWDALVLNDYEAVWPLPCRKKFGIKYFYRPYAVQQLGIFGAKKLGAKTIAAFVEEMQKNCRYSEVYLNEDQMLTTKNRKQEEWPNRNLTIDLSASYREIYHAFNQNTRRNIKKAAKNDLELFEHDDPNALIAIFKKNRGQSLGLNEEFFRNMEKVMYRCLHKNVGKIWTVYGSHNSICAGAFFVETERRHTLLFTALTEEGKERSAMHWLINEYLIYQSAKPKVFDFEGSNTESLARFYGGFGAKEQSYFGLRYNNLPWPIRWLKGRESE